MSVFMSVEEMIRRVNYNKRNGNKFSISRIFKAGKSTV
ncbi:hypothetical protein V6Z12_A11G346900 [Gossypium hirsutum]